MASEHNDYRDILESISRLSKVKEHHNRLNKIRMATEDSRLREFLHPVIEYLRSAELDIRATKRSNVNFAFNPKQEGPIRNLCLYCQECIVSKKPQWQIIAEREGWTPIVRRNH